MNRQRQIIAIGLVALYVAFQIPSWFGPAKGEGNGFEFSVAKHASDAQQTRWSVKMSVGTLDLNLNWNP